MALCLGCVACASSKGKSAARTKSPLSITDKAATDAVTTPVVAHAASDINASKAPVMQLSHRGIVASYPDGGFVLFIARKAESVLNGPTPVKYGVLEAKKYDKNKKLVWDKKFPSLTDVCYAATVTPDGGTLIATDINYVVHNELNYTSQGYFSKISASGALEWRDKLVQNYQYIDQIDVAANGDIYTSGAYYGGGVDGPGDVSGIGGPSASWQHCGQDACVTLALGRYDQSGKMQAHQISDISNSLAEGNIASLGSVYYQEGVGLIVDHGICCACYDANLQKKWVCQYPNTPADQSYENMKVGDYSSNATTRLTKTGILVCADNRDGSQERVLKVSFEGKLTSTSTFTLSPARLSGVWTDSRIDPLPDGRCVYGYSNYTSGTQVSFFSQGKVTTFDDFKDWLRFDGLTPDAGGGFTVGYAVLNAKNGKGAVEIDSSAASYVITKYNSVGNVEYQKVFKAPQSKNEYDEDTPSDNYQVLPDGTILIFN